MRQRVEDLGRLAVMIKHLLEAEVFEKYEHIRKKDFLDWFTEQTEEKRDDIVHTLIYGLSDIEQRLWELHEIAMGEDVHNQKDDGE